jgi:hypothetical protein
MYVRIMEYNLLKMQEYQQICVTVYLNEGKALLQHVTFFL